MLSSALTLAPGCGHYHEKAKEAIRELRYAQPHDMLSGGDRQDEPSEPKSFSDQMNQTTKSEILLELCLLLLVTGKHELKQDRYFQFFVWTSHR